MIDPKDGAGVTIPTLLIPTKGEEKKDVDAYEKELKVEHKVEWFDDQVHGFMSAR